MRPIKFRAWDTAHKKMWSAEEMGEDQLTIAVDGSGFINVHGDDKRLSSFLKHLVPLQFTGLLDKNGKEIYEGDIVRDSVDSNAEEIVFDKTKWVRSGISWKRFMTRDGDPYTTDLWEYTARKELEVIGNIHENPELIK